MKNLFLLETDKPSRLQQFEGFDGIEFELCSKDEFFNKGMNIYIINDEEIKVADWVIALDTNIVFKCNKYEAEKPIKQFKDIYKKIILTADKKLIQDGVQAIDDEFLEWFVKNPSCEEVEIKHKDVVQYGNMTMYDHNGDGSHYFCKDCELETSRSKEELLKFGVEYYKIIIPKEEPDYTALLKQVGTTQETLEQFKKKA